MERKKKDLAKNLLMLVTLVIGVCACNNDEFDVIDSDITLARRTTRAASEENFSPNEVWVIDSSNRTEEDVEVCAGYKMTISYYWTEAEYYPNNYCTINVNAQFMPNYPANLIINHDTILKNIKAIDAHVVQPHATWEKRWKYGGTIAFNSNIELHCTVEDTCMVKDSCGHVVILNKGHDKDTLIEIPNFKHKFDVYQVAMHPKEK